MGIKKLKEEFDIQHIVQVSMNNGDIFIGSGYVHDLITIKKDYDIKWSSILSGGGKLENLRDRLISAKENGKLQEVLDSEDIFNNLKVVFTSKNGKVIKKWCEEFGYPNTTTDGELIYDNTFFQTRQEALKFGKKEAKWRANSVFENLGDDFHRVGKQLSQLIKESICLFRAYALRGY